MAFISALPLTLRCRTSSRSQGGGARNVKRAPRCSARQETSPPEPPQRDDELPLELVEGYLENAKVRPKIDIDADEYMLMWKLRKMLHEDDFNKIFDSNSRRIGEL